MQFDQGTRIFSMEGKLVGRMDRVVINTKTMEITHIVIHTGVIITQDKVVPLNRVTVEEQGRVMLRLHPSQLARMPDFGTTHYRAVNEERRDEGPASLPPPAYGHPPEPATSMNPTVGQPPMRGTRVNIPAGTVALAEGAKVVSADGKHLGHLERVLTRPLTDRAAYLQISKGRWFKERKLVPIEWVDQLEEDHVYLAVGSRTIQDLPE